MQQAHLPATVRMFGAPVEQRPVRYRTSLVKAGIAIEEAELYKLEQVKEDA